MQLSNISKALLIAIPALFLTACGSTTEEQQAGAEQATNAAQTAEAKAAEEVKAAEVAKMEEEARLEEIKQQKNEALLKTQTIYFDFDKSKVDSKYLELLQAHAEFLIKNPSQKVTVEGHCDERGTPEYNIALGERRAKAVAQYLQSLGVVADQVSVVSYGEEKPADRSRSEAGFAKNRRAVLAY